MGDAVLRQPVTRFYAVRKGIEWARFWVTDDGCLSIVSDYGNYGYWWGAPGMEFRLFLSRDRDTDYLASKLWSGQRQVFKIDATRKEIKRAIIRERRGGHIDRERARQEWELLNGLDDEFDLRHWWENTRLPGAEELPEYGYPGQLSAFLERLWPLFVDALRAELEAEAKGAA